MWKKRCGMPPRFAPPGNHRGATPLTSFGGTKIVEREGCENRDRDGKKYEIALTGCINRDHAPFGPPIRFAQGCENRDRDDKLSMVEYQ